ncbi:MAG TPA: hypothetical protein VFU22_11075 [Roseiflexaceae bacterium]|nr:hypothetical protein [Roseiflexaceae bacterium]
MRARVFLLGLAIGLLLAPASGRQLWLRSRNLLAAAIDRVLRQANRRARAGASTTF